MIIPCSAVPSCLLCVCCWLRQHLTDITREIHLLTVGRQMRQSSNPYRREVLSWYHTIVKSAFSVPWRSDDDAMYVLSEARKLFRQNQHITELEVIRRKIEEAEMRHTIAVHYLIPYPRPSHKAQGSTQESGIAMQPELDSLFDSDHNPRIGNPRSASAVTQMTGGAPNGEAAIRMADHISGLDDTEEGLTFQESPNRRVPSLN